MAKIAIITDTNSGMPREEADKLGVFLLPISLGNTIQYICLVVC